VSLLQQAGCHAKISNARGGYILLRINTKQTTPLSNTPSTPTILLKRRSIPVVFFIDVNNDLIMETYTVHTQQGNIIINQINYNDAIIWHVP
jgi:hypothetical protein